MDLHALLSVEVLLLVQTVVANVGQSLVLPLRLHPVLRAAEFRRWQLGHFLSHCRLVLGDHLDPLVYLQSNGWQKVWQNEGICGGRIRGRGVGRKVHAQI